LQKVKLIFRSNNPGLTMEQPSGNRFSIKDRLKNFNQSLLKIFQSKLD